MGEHTPGPWHIHHKADEKPGDLPWIGGHMGRPLAFVAHESILKEDLARAEANARLIAAAPELLEALENIVPRFKLCCLHAGSDEQFSEGAVERFRKVIAKARGQSSQQQAAE